MIRKIPDPKLESHTKDISYKYAMKLCRFQEFGQFNPMINIVEFPRFITWMSPKARRLMTATYLRSQLNLHELGQGPPLHISTNALSINFLAFRSAEGGDTLLDKPAMVARYPACLLVEKFTALLSLFIFQLLL